MSGELDSQTRSMQALRHWQIYPNNCFLCEPEPVLQSRFPVQYFPRFTAITWISCLKTRIKKRNPTYSGIVDNVNPTLWSPHYGPHIIVPYILGVGPLGITSRWLYPVLRQFSNGLIIINVIITNIQ